MPLSNGTTLQGGTRNGAIVEFARQCLANLTQLADYIGFRVET